MLTRAVPFTSVLWLGCAAAEGAGDPAADPCVIAAQKASAGDFVSLEQARADAAPFALTVEEWVERNLWRDPGTLILRFFEDEMAGEPYVMITETLTANGMTIEIAQEGETEVTDLAFRYDCTLDAATGAYRFDMFYERDLAGARHEFMNQIEGDADAFSLTRLARLKGSDAPYRWMSTLTALRPAADQ